MDQMHDPPAADVLVEARRHLEAAQKLGVSRETLYQLLQESRNASSNNSVAPAVGPVAAVPVSGEGGSVGGQGQEQAQQDVAMEDIKWPLVSPSADSTWSADKWTTTAIFGGAETQLQSQTQPQSHDAVLEDASTRALFHGLPGPFAPWCHKKHFSVSSTSSGSSGRASIWSTATGASNASNTTHYSQHAASTPPPAAPRPVLAQIQPLPKGQSKPAPPPPCQSPAWAAPPKYWCTSCDTSFKRKYDWKRHEEEFHERWKKYPCPEPGCNRSFWGANTFNQHHKTSHGCTTCPHADKVIRYLRKRKYWACGFCSALHPSRERHVEHVARHFEAGKTKADWMHSRVVYGLMHQPLIHEAWKRLLASKAVEHGTQQPNFSWHPNKTGRAQGFLEGENPGQLQDLLEFFSGSEAEAQSIVQLAYTLSDIVFASSTSNPISPVPFTDHQSMPPPYTPTAPTHQLPSQLHSQGHFKHAVISDEPSQHQFIAQTMMPPPPLFSQQETQARPNPSPLRRSSLDRELPPPPEPPAIFEFLPSPGLFDDWQSIATTMVDEAAQSAPNREHNHAQHTTHQTQHQMQHTHQTTPVNQTIPEWHVVQYFAPGVSS